MNNFLWAVFPYFCFTLFFVVPIIRMIFRPYGFTTRATGLFNRRLLGIASLLFHWGLLAVLIGHLAGWIGGLYGLGPWIAFFYWIALFGGLMTAAGSVIALGRRVFIAEVRAMSQAEDYIVHLFLIAILGLGLYQVIIDRIFGVAYTAAPWFASIWTLSPQPELMASATLTSKLHIFLALAFFAYFPFTKMVHFWSLPVNYFVRPYQTMRTARFWAHKKWEFALRTDKSYLLFASGLIIVAAVVIAAVPKDLLLAGSPDGDVTSEYEVEAQLTGYPLYVSQCARCHGLEGAGDGPGAASPTFATLPRDLVAGDYRFVSTDNGVASDVDLHRTLVDGLPSAGMPAFDRLSRAQLQSLVQVLDALWQARPAAGQAIAIGPVPPSDSDVLAQGREIYANSCAVCHGPGGEGDGPASGGVRDAAGLGLPAANLAGGEIKTGQDTEQIYLRIAAGIPNGENGYFMPPFAHLGNDQIWAVVRYLEQDILP